MASAFGGIADAARAELLPTCAANPHASMSWHHFADAGVQCTATYKDYPYDNVRSWSTTMFMRWILPGISALMVLAMASSAVSQNTKPRARDLGIPFDGTPGSLNAITDVKGVAVGHTTLISGEGKLKVGVGPDFAARAEIHGACLRRLVLAQWQRRNDRHHVDRRIRLS
jgi:hypothetical protein